MTRETILKWITDELEGFDLQSRIDALEDGELLGVWLGELKCSENMLQEVTEDLHDELSKKLKKKTS